jgi:ABC-type glycerol-3-phosphate transport system substrate-binding protein
MLVIVMAILLMFVGLLTGCPTVVDDPETIYVAVVNKGYGIKFVEELMKEYTKRTGVKTELAWEVPLEERVRTTLLAGPKTNNVDVYFNINDYLVNGVLGMGEVVKGYPKALVDLTDLYDEAPEGFGGKTINELMYPHYKDVATFYDGKRYFIIWATGLCSMVYNAKLFRQYNLSIPRTTEEMFELMDTMKTLNNGGYLKTGVNKDRNVYPFVYPGKNNYCENLINTWRAQYQGVQAYYNTMQGKNEEGEYTYEIYGDRSILEAYKVVERMVYIGENNQTSNGYVSPECISDYIFTQAQLQFLKGEAFMTSNGDWLEREAENNVPPGSVEIAFMRVPIISSIIDKLPKNSITNDQKLREVIGLIDDELAGEEVTIPEDVDQEDYDFLKEARLITFCQSANHQMFIPSYSNNIERAKEFIMFTMSKDAQEIVLKYSYGNTYPLDMNVEEFESYNDLTVFQKSKFEIMKQGVTWIGIHANHPMYYSGGLMSNYIYPETRMGLRTTAKGSYMTAEEIFRFQYNYYKENWTYFMETSGVSN